MQIRENFEPGEGIGCGLLLFSVHFYGHFENGSATMATLCYTFNFAFMATSSFSVFHFFSVGLLFRRFFCFLCAFLSVWEGGPAKWAVGPFLLALVR